MALLARGRGGLAAAAKDVESAGGTALAIPTDVADARQVEAAADRVEDELGPIDVWVNVAFTSVFAPFHEHQRRRVPPGHRGDLPRLRQRHHGGAVAGCAPGTAGTIVQVGSALGYRAIPLQSAYCGAKHAINGFTESLRTELLHERSNVHITVVQMPAVNTPQFSWVLSRLPRQPQPVPPIYQPEVAARAVVYAADHPRAQAVLGGSEHGRHPARPRSSRPRCSTATWPAPDSTPSRPTSPLPPDRPDNLWEPVDDRRDDYGAHGAFDAKSHARDPQQWCSRHPRLTASGALAATALLAAVARRRPAHG